MVGMVAASPITTGWGPSSIVKLVYNYKNHSDIVYDAQITIFGWGPIKQQT